MIHGKRLVVVMREYDAERTVEKTVREIPQGFVDEIVPVDDASRDHTTPWRSGLAQPMKINFPVGEISCSGGTSPSHPRFRSAASWVTGWVCC